MGLISDVFGNNLVLIAFIRSWGIAMEIRMEESEWKYIFARF